MNNPVKNSVPKSLEQNSGNFILHQNGLVYEIKATAKQGTQLRATLRVTKASQETPHELATIDLYSHRSRQWFADLCAKRFNGDTTIILDDLNVIIQHIENQSGSTSTESNQPIVVTDTDRTDAMKLLLKPNLMECIYPRP